MTDFEAGYIHGISEVHRELQRLMHDPDTSAEGKLKLLHMLSYADRLLSLPDALRKKEAHGASNENARDLGE